MTDYTSPFDSSGIQTQICVIEWQQGRVLTAHSACVCVIYLPQHDGKFSPHLPRRWRALSQQYVVVSRPMLLYVHVYYFINCSYRWLTHFPRNLRHAQSNLHVRVRKFKLKWRRVRPRLQHRKKSCDSCRRQTALRTEDEVENFSVFCTNWFITRAD